MKIRIKKPEPRPCIVNGRRALLHDMFVKAWMHGTAATIGGFTAGQEAHACAIVEYEDGHLDEVHIGSIRMLDSDLLFKRYLWKEESDAD